MACWARLGDARAAAGAAAAPVLLRREAEPRGWRLAHLDQPRRARAPPARLEWARGSARGAEAGEECVVCVAVDVSADGAQFGIGVSLERGPAEEGGAHRVEASLEVDPPSLCWRGRKHLEESCALVNRHDGAPGTSGTAVLRRRLVEIEALMFGLQAAITLASDASSICVGGLSMHLIAQLEGELCSVEQRRIECPCCKESGASDDDAELEERLLRRRIVEQLAQWSRFKLYAQREPDDNVALERGTNERQQLAESSLSSVIYALESEARVEAAKAALESGPAQRATTQLLRLHELREVCHLAEQRLPSREPRAATKQPATPEVSFGGRREAVIKAASCHCDVAGRDDVAGNVDVVDPRGKAPNSCIGGEEPCDAPEQDRGRHLQHSDCPDDKVLRVTAVDGTMPNSSDQHGEAAGIVAQSGRGPRKRMKKVAEHQNEHTIPVAQPSKGAAAKRGRRATKKGADEKGEQDAKTYQQKRRPAKGKENAPQKPMGSRPLLPFEEREVLSQLNFEQNGQRVEEFGLAPEVSAPASRSWTFPEGGVEIPSHHAALGPQAQLVAASSPKSNSENAGLETSDLKAWAPARSWSRDDLDEWLSQPEQERTILCLA